MTLSLGTGGGNTFFNLLEPCPIEGEVLHATPNVKRHGFGEIVTSQSGQLREAVLSLARNPERCRELDERAYYFGRERHYKTTNSARLWQALFQVYKSSRNSCK